MPYRTFAVATFASLMLGSIAFACPFGTMDQSAEAKAPQSPTPLAQSKAQPIQSNVAEARKAADHADAQKTVDAKPAAVTEPARESSTTDVAQTDKVNTPPAKPKSRVAPF